MTPQVLLKARPTPTQLADRLRAPRPDGLELYLDTVDLASAEAMDGVVANLDACDLPDDFTLLVEGPIRSLDGEFFDLTRDSDADRELMRRLIDLAGRIGARGANVHAIAPDADPAALTVGNRARLLDRALGPLRQFAELAQAAGVVPTIENMPPILRMRESGFYFSAIGMPPQDMTELARSVPGVKVIFDVAHAELYLNVRRGIDEEIPGRDISALRQFVKEVPGADSLDEYVDILGDTLTTCHIADAAGLLGEALAFGEGNVDLDQLTRYLATRVRYLVTETLEPNNDRAEFMRDAQTKIQRVLAGQ